jgi:hypothetical protein
MSCSYVQPKCKITDTDQPSGMCVESDNNNNNKLQMGRHPVAVFILHITYARTMKVD